MVLLEYLENRCKKQNQGNFYSFEEIFWPEKTHVFRFNPLRL